MIKLNISAAGSCFYSRRKIKFGFLCQSGASVDFIAHMTNLWHN